jgi:hypothetical protein
MTFLKNKITLSQSFYMSFHLVDAFSVHGILALNEKWLYYIRITEFGRAKDTFL